MATIKLNKNKPASDKPSGPGTRRAPVRGGGGVAKPRPTLAQAQAERAERQAAFEQRRAEESQDQRRPGGRPDPRAEGRPGGRPGGRPEQDRGARGPGGGGGYRPGGQAGGGGARGGAQGRGPGSGGGREAWGGRDGDVRRPAGGLHDSRDDHGSRYTQESRGHREDRYAREDRGSRDDRGPRGDRPAGGGDRPAFGRDRGGFGGGDRGGDRGGFGGGNRGGDRGGFGGRDRGPRQDFGGPRGEGRGQGRFDDGRYDANDQGPQRSGGRYGEGPRDDRGGSGRYGEGPRDHRGASGRYGDGPRDDRGGSGRYGDGPRNDRGAGGRYGEGPRDNRDSRGGSGRYGDAPRQGGSSGRYGDSTGPGADRGPRHEGGPREDWNSPGRSGAPQHGGGDVSETPRVRGPVPQRQADPSEGERLSKRMSELGLASRREADEWIEAGWVTVDGKLAELGQRVGPEVKIEIDPAARDQQAQRVTILLHKPIGYVSGQAEDGYEPASVLVKADTHWSEDPASIHWAPGHGRNLAPAGRLDIDSTGLLVLTQDGRIARHLIGEDSNVEKEYLVRVAVEQGNPEVPAQHQLEPRALALLNHGLELDGVELKPAKVSWANEDQLRFVLREGRKRQIRRMCEAVGLKVLALKRVRIGRIPLGQLPAGQWRYLAPWERF